MAKSAIAATAANVVPFPSRGGKGFNTSNWRRHYDRTNLVRFADGLGRRQLAKENELSPALVQTPELLIAMSIYAELTGVQRARVQATVQETFHRSGDEASRAAAQVLARISLRDREGC